jgi:hypothetical protein
MASTDGKTSPIALEKETGHVMPKAEHECTRG